MTESNISTLDNKPLTGSNTDVVNRVSYTSRFKIMSSRSSASQSRFGGIEVNDAVVANSTIPKTEIQHKTQDKVSSRQGTPTIGGNISRIGHSLFHIANEMRARRIKLYRNGDRFFKGMIYAVSNERFRSFQTLLSALTSSAVCDSKSMPNGVRSIFSLDGSRRIETIDDLQEGKSYVCASMDSFRNLDYAKDEDPAWNTQVFLHHQKSRIPFKKKEKVREDHGSYVSESYSTSSSHSQPRPASAPGEKQESWRSRLYKSDGGDTKNKNYEDYQRSFVTPRLITLIRNGRRPRKTVRLLLNKKTAQSFQQVITDINEVIQFDCGKVKNVHTISGQQVQCLADFFQIDTVFLVCGGEKPSVDDFILSKDENSQIRALRTFNGKPREKITANKPFKLSSKFLKTSLIASKNLTQETQHPKSAELIPVKLPIPIALSNKYDVGKLIGTGKFAVVMECTDKKTNKKYALKIINKENCKGKEDIIDNEVRILRCVKHPNIIRLVEDYTSQYQIYCVMELIKGGDLFDAIASSTSKYTEQDASCMLYNLASALKYLHALYIVHRDVKPENILIRQLDDGTKSLKLGDFGLATEVRGPLYTVCGTPTYVAPEIIDETGYGLKVDLWSAGVITYILLCGFPPFVSSADDQDELFDMITTGTYDYPSPIWDDVSSTAKDVISQMLDVNPETRLSAAQVLDHKWVYTTALDKASKFFRGRRLQPSTAPDKEV